MHIVISLCLLIGVWFHAHAAQACSAFLLQRGKTAWMGKSYDWHNGDGLLITNKKHVRKQALLLTRALTPARWTSKYGSLTFNQYGRELPLGGINEKGLAIEVLWLPQSQYKRPVAGRSTLNELQWIQYHLDTSASVQEMIRNNRQVQISQVYAQVHYFACDPGGACATFEWIRGKLHVHSGKKLPIRALTNHSYRQSLQFFRQKKGLLQRLRLGGGGSLARFYRTGKNLERYQKAKALSHKQAFKMLRNVRMQGYSQWNIVYNLAKKKVHFRDASADAWMTISLAKLDFRCKTPVQVMDLRGTILKGKRLTWKPYTAQANMRMIRRAMGKLARVRGAQFPVALLRKIASYPKTNTCTKRK